jgi:hypothetical protein
MSDGFVPLAKAPAAILVTCGPNGEVAVGSRDLPTYL